MSADAAKPDRQSPAARPVLTIGLTLLAASAVVNGTTAAVLTSGFVDFRVAPFGGLLALIGGVWLLIYRHAVTGARWWLLRLAIIASVALVGFSLWNMATSAKDHASRYASSSSRTEPAHGQP